jgi:hypothetical protein
MLQEKRQIVITPTVFNSGISYPAMILWGHANLIGDDAYEFPESFLNKMPGLTVQQIKKLGKEIKDKKLNWWDE